MNARTRWTIWSVAASSTLIAIEAHALREPITAEKPSEAYTAWWRWAVGIQPSARRRFVLVPLFSAFWLWFVGHIVLGWGPRDIPRRRR